LLISLSLSLSLSLSAAFLDPKSGMVNLVVEYMDGGSLQDVVDGGGYREELVLADIAYQVCYIFFL
jgi:serine/threonine protein kinase